MIKYASCAASAAFALMLAMPAQAADLDERMAVQSCAVSAPNGKIHGAGGSIHSDDDDIEGSRYFGGITLTGPLGCEFGFQIDGVAGHLGDDSTWSVGGHLFARDPSSYLLGVYGEHTQIGDEDVNRIAVEGELYLDQITLSGIVGFEDSDISNDDVFGAGIVSFYATDNLNLQIGYAKFLDVDTLLLGAEWQPDGSDISLFAMGEIGEDDHSTFLGGMRYHFGGEQKSLIRRHREDDPITWATWLKTGGDDEMCPPGYIYVPEKKVCFIPEENPE